MPKPRRRRKSGASGCRKSPTDFFDAFTIPRFSGRSAARKSAAARRKRLLAQAFCRHLIPHEGAPAPSYSPCKMQPSCFKQRFFDKLRRRKSGACFSACPFGRHFFALKRHGTRASAKARVPCHRRKGETEGVSRLAMIRRRKQAQNFTMISSRISALTSPLSEAWFMWL